MEPLRTWFQLAANHWEALLFFCHVSHLIIYTGSGRLIY